MWAQLAANCHSKMDCDASVCVAGLLWMCKWNEKQRDYGRKRRSKLGCDWKPPEPVCVYLNTHIRAFFEAAYNRFKLFPHTLVTGLKNFWGVQGLIEGMPGEDDVKEWGTLCFSASLVCDPRWVDKEARHSLRNKEPRSESKCAHETLEFFTVTRRMVSGCCDLISNVTVTIGVVLHKRQYKENLLAFCPLLKLFFCIREKN